MTEEATLSSITAQITDIVNKRAPEKLPHVLNLLTGTWVGRELELLEKIRERYGISQEESERDKKLSSIRAEITEILERNAPHERDRYLELLSTTFAHKEFQLLEKIREKYLPISATALSGSTSILPLSSLVVGKIQCFDLDDVELLSVLGDKNDVYVKIRIDGTEHQTETIMNAGANATFEVMFPFSWSGDIAHKSVLVQVFDFEGLRAHVLIGEAVLTLGELIASVESATPHGFDITNQTRTKKTGRVVLHASKRGIGSTTVFSCESALPAAVSASFAPVSSLIVQKIQCSDLDDVELLSVLGDNNDVYVKIRIDGTEHQTETIMNAGANATFEVMFPFSWSGDIAHKSVLVQVFDFEGLRAHVLIGEAVLTLGELIASVESATPHGFDITNQTRTKKTGRVVLHASRQSIGSTPASALGAEL